MKYLLKRFIKNTILKMLGLSHLQNIFERNKINFDELLILSMKDLEKLQIPKNE